jgi:murein DD-endopeptidase MepM/ murein hydrolase activator NlpD
MRSKADPEERRGGVHIIIVPQRRGQTRTLKLPGWAVNYALGGAVALAVIMIGGLFITTYMGFKLTRLHAAEQENITLREENSRIAELERELSELDDLRQRVIQLAGSNPRIKIESAPAGGRTGRAQSGAASANAPGTAANNPQTAKPEPPRIETAKLETARPETAPVSEKSSAPTRWPVDGVISKDFELESLPDKEHHGIDIAASHGAPVRAAGSGVVAFAGLDSVFGQLVIIEHGGGLQSLYGHNSVLEVGAGDWVQAGQQIARVGSTGESSAPHLHFEVRRGGAPVDPREYLAR